MRKTFGIALMILFVAAWASAVAAPQAKGQAWDAIKLGKKNRIGDKVFFTFKPGEKPKVGSFNIRVQVIDKSPKKDKAWTLKGAVSLAGQAVPADAAFKPFDPKKARLYVLPLTIGKPGQWEFRMIILRDGKVVYRGLAKFAI